jgi:hypothetical protein
MGAALKKMQAQVVREEDVQADKKRTSPRAHIRRAHWHGYWSGSREHPNERKYEIKWMPPCLVMGDEEENLPATVRRVK